MSKSERRGLARTVRDHPDLRLLLWAAAVSQAGDWIYSVALLVFVFNRTHSAAWVAAAGIVRMLPHLLSLLGGAVADRYDRRKVMLASDLVRAVLMGMLALTAFVSGPVVIAIALSFLLSLTSTPYAPATAAVIPTIVPENDLAAANAVFSTIEYLALAVGPALGGALLLLGPAWVAFLVDACTFVLSALLVFALRTRAASPAERTHSTSMFHDVLEGLKVSFGSSDVLVLVGAIFLATYLYGHETVYLVLVSRDFLNTGSNGVGFLLGAIGAGGILGAGISSRLAKLPRAGTVLAASVCLCGASLMLLSVVRSPAIAYVVMTLDGIGSVAIDVVAVTMLQRTLDKGLISRVYGILHSVAVVGVLLGSFVAPAILDLWGLQIALLVAGGLLPAIALGVLPKLQALERESAASSRAAAPVVERLGALAMFTGASLQALETIARSLTEETIPAGKEVVREGEAPEDFFVILSGSFDVTSGGTDGGAAKSVNQLTPGDCFGEIGLIEGIPRTATVTATTEGRVYRIPGADFLASVSMAPSISTLMSDTVATRLARTHPARARREERAGQSGPLGGAGD